MHITFHIDMDKESRSQQHFVEYLMDKTGTNDREELFKPTNDEVKWVKKDENKPIGLRYITCVIVFHRINGAFFVRNTIQSLIEQKQRKEKC